eukprot:2470577-Rhodomonas_salina.1
MHKFLKGEVAAICKHSKVYRQIMSSSRCQGVLGDGAPCQWTGRRYRLPILETSSETGWSDPAI